MWRGQPLAEFADTGFAAGVITRLEEARLAVTEDRIEAELMLGAHGELAGELEALVAAHPLRERLWGQLMLALYRSGRQGDALGAYRRARTVLADELGIDPGTELQQLEAAVLAQDPVLAAPAGQIAEPAGHAADNLPAAASALIGRDAEVDAVGELLRSSRLVTITGTGGVGKTRLAIEVARGLAGNYQDGAWLVELAPVGDDAGVAAAMAGTLGVIPESGRDADAGQLRRLGEFLARRQALLVLDNCEHVITGAARAASHLLARCPQLEILATSRESLAVAGECLWPLEPLGMDAAAELFEARARAAVPGFPADEQTMTAIGEICARLDGLPLAIELAAARMRALAPGDVLARLGDRFRLLVGGLRTAPPRHHTLRAVIDWSYELLFDDERRVFEAMSVFAGPCPLEAAEQVCTGPDIAQADVADLLARLVDRSLIGSAQTSRGVRFRMLQTLADYGRERLAERGELAAVRARHARWVASLAGVTDGEHTPMWFGSVAEFIADVRRAMDSALAADDSVAAPIIACGIGWLLDDGMFSGEDCWQWVSAALALAPAGTALRVRALATAGQFALAQGRDNAVAYGEEAVELGRAVGDRPALAFASILHSYTLTGYFAQRQRAVSLLEEASALLQAEADGWSQAMARLTRGVALLAQSEPGRAQPPVRAAARRFADMGNGRSATDALRHLADLAVVSGEYDDAIAALREALAFGETNDAPRIISMAKIGCLYALQGQFDQSDKWHAQAIALAEGQQHPSLLAYTCNARGLSCRVRGRFDEAERWHRRALELCQRRGMSSGIAMALASLGHIAERRGDCDAAHRHLGASLTAAWTVADRQAQALALEGLAGVASRHGDEGTTGRLLGAASVLREGTVGAVLGAATAMRGMTLGRLAAIDRTGIDRAIGGVGDRDAFDAAYTQGAGDPLAVLSAVLS